MTGNFLPRFALDAEYQSVANNFYHAGTLQVTKRFSRNYSINANYTLSKTIDEATDFNTDYRSTCAKTKAFRYSTSDIVWF